MVNTNAGMEHNGPSAYFDEDGRAIFRASAVASCEAALVHSLRGLEPMPVPDDMMRRFQDGHMHEASILAEVEAAGWVIESGQDEVSIDITDKIRIVGHVDGIASKHGIRAVVEAKTMSQGAFEKWAAKMFDAYPRYAQQITVYMHALGKLPAVYAVKNKNSSQVRIDIIEAPPYLLAKIKAKLIRVARDAGSDKTPSCPKNFDYPCPYFHMHEEREKAGKSKELGVDPTELRPELEEAAHNYNEATAQEKYWKDRRAEIKTEMLEKLGNESTAATDLYDIEVTRTSTKRLNTARLRAANPDLSQYEDVGETVTLKVKTREGV